MEKMNKFSLDRIFSNKKFAIVVSIFVAIIAWFIVVMVNDSGGVVTVYDVPITFATEKTKAQQLDLDVISIEPRSVAVKIRGPRYKIGLITEKDIVVSPVSMINVTSDGTYNISLVIDSNVFIISILFFSEVSKNFIPFLMAKSSPSLYDTILLSSK